MILGYINLHVRKKWLGYIWMWEKVHEIGISATLLISRYRPARCYRYRHEESNQAVDGKELFAISTWMFNMNPSHGKIRQRHHYRGYLDLIKHLRWSVLLKQLVAGFWIRLFQNAYNLQGRHTEHRQKLRTARAYLNSRWKE